MAAGDGGGGEAVLEPEPQARGGSAAPPELTMPPIYILCPGGPSRNTAGQVMTGDLAPPRNQV